MLLRDNTSIANQALFKKSCALGGCRHSYGFPTNFMWPHAPGGSALHSNDDNGDLLTLPSGFHLFPARKQDRFFQAICTFRSYTPTGY